MALTKVIGDGVGTLASATITSATISNQLTDANMSPGSVLQVVYASLSHSSTTLSGTGFTEIGLNGNITPISTNNVILFYIHHSLDFIAPIAIVVLDGVLREI